MNLTELSVKNRTTVFFLMVAVFLAGVTAYRTLPREAFPDIQIPQIIVYTLWPGASPDDVESQVTDLVERELQGVEGLEELTSTSQESASVVTVEFVAGTDIDDALQKVRDRVDRAQVDFPDEAEEPVLQEINFSDIPILQMNLSGDVGPVVLKRLAEDLKDELETISGVLRVNLVGGLEREVKVEADPERLRLYDLTLQDVVDAIGDENVAIPGGDFDLGPRTFAVRVPGEVEDPLEMADFVVTARDGDPIYVSDVATVTYGFEDRDSYARINRQEAVALTVQKRLGANVVEVADQVKEMARSEAETWPTGVELTLLGDLSKDVRTIVKDLENNILSGLVLVVIVLMFALGLRNATFVGIAIPFSMLLTFIVISMAGLTLNNVVLFSLVLAVGMLVDNAVVVIENIYRHMQDGKPRIRSALQGTREVGAAIVVSTLTTLAAFSPLLFWPGTVGDFMFFMPLTVSIVLACSLVVALTVNPVLSAAFMKVPKVKAGQAPGAELVAGASGAGGGGNGGGDGRDDGSSDTGADDAPRGRRSFSPAAWSEGLGDRVSRLYEASLSWSLDHRVVVVVGTVALFVAVVLLFGVFNTGIEFFPETEPPQIIVDVEMDPGTRLERTDSVITILEERLVDTPDLEILAGATGAGSQAEFGVGGGGNATQGRITLDLFDREERQQDSFRTMDQVREVTAGLPGVTVTVERPAEGPPVGAPLAIEISGEDFATLGEIAERVMAEIEDIPGLVSLDSDFDLARPELVVDVDRTQASRLGLTTADIASAVRTAVTGTEASTYRKGEEDEEVDVTVRLPPEARRSIEDLGQLAVRGADGALVPLASVAELRQDSALTSIKHKNRRRVVTVSGDVTSPQLAEPVRSEARERLEALDQELGGGLLPAGYSLEFAGQSEDEAEAQAFLGRAFLVAVLLVLAIMVAKFDSLAIPLIIITSVLMSMVGVLLGLMVTGLPFGIIMTGLGVISLAGIVVNNAIVLLDYGEQIYARRRELGLDRRQVVMLTGIRRMRPVLLTAVTTILGLIPLSTGVEFDFTRFVFATGGESSQWWRGMGVAVIFGLAFATFLTLILVPVLYDLYLQFQEARARRRAERGDRSEEDEMEPVPAE